MYNNAEDCYDDVLTGIYAGNFCIDQYNTISSSGNTSLACNAGKACYNRAITYCKEFCNGNSTCEDKCISYNEVHCS